MPQEIKNDKLLLTLSVIGFALTAICARLLELSAPFRLAANNAALALFLILLSALTLIAFWVWGFHQKNFQERKAYAASTIICGVLSILFFIIAPASGFFLSRALISIPVLVLAFVFGTMSTAAVAILLGVYRKLRHGNYGMALLTYGILLILYLGLSLYGLGYAQNYDVLIFGTGFNNTWFTFLTLLFFILPVVLYEPMLKSKYKTSIY